MARSHPESRLETCGAVSFFEGRHLGYDRNPSYNVTCPTFSFPVLQAEELSQAGAGQMTGEMRRSQFACASPCGDQKLVHCTFLFNKLVTF